VVVGVTVGVGVAFTQEQLVMLQISPAGQLWAKHLQFEHDGGEPSHSSPAAGSTTPLPQHSDRGGACAQAPMPSQAGAGSHGPVRADVRVQAVEVV
jgi:hypothetical protein